MDTFNDPKRALLFHNGGEKGNKKLLQNPVGAPDKRIRLGSVRTQVQSLVWLSSSGIQCRLQTRTQTRLGSRVAVAVA